MAASQHDKHSTRIEIAEARGSGVRRITKVLRGGVLCGIGALLVAATPVCAATTAPGLSAFTGIQSWISQYGTAGAPVAVSLGGLLFAVEHHQQRTGNAVRAKGYIFAACAGLIVISLAGTIVSAVSGLTS